MAMSMVLSPALRAHRLRATLIGGIAALLWASLALLTTLARPVPPLQLVALTFGIAFAAALAKWCVEGRAAFAQLRQPWPVWLLVAFGRAEASWIIAASCVLVVGGALIAARDLWRR